MVKITKKLLEKHGFNVTKDEQGYNIQQHTPAGEDWSMFFEKIQDLEEYARYMEVQRIVGLKQYEI